MIESLAIREGIRWFGCGLMALSLGCDGAESGPVRYPLNGAITFEGKPVPAGTIVFEPDTSLGNSGPAGVADIKQGQFSTRPGEGTVGGPHIARITGYDGRPPEGPEAELKPAGELLFGPVPVSVDLPKAEGARDFALSAN